MNTETPKLSIVVGTYNRLDQIQRCVESILGETTTPFVLFITDAGSTDGTVEYLESIRSDVIKPLLIGKLLGQAKAYNDVFALVTTPYVCWLSDDNVVVNNGIDRALSILKSDQKIGMVALKTKDMQGPFVGTPYIGGISEAGILNVNQGVLPTPVLTKVGGFSEEFRDYGIDPALTAEVLFAGYKVAYTKQVSLYHFRNWDENPDSANYKWLKERHVLAKELYAKKYCPDNCHISSSYRLRLKLSREIKRLMLYFLGAQAVRQSSYARDLNNVLLGKFISMFDPFISFGKEYHLLQYVKKDGGRNS